MEKGLQAGLITRSFMNSSLCPTHLVSDAPADGDTLGGAHERLARAIVDVIESEAGGKAIGLEGVWGAGKSTVVGLITRRLNHPAGQQPTHVVVFDVWAHQGDPLRRTFLENLIKGLGPKPEGAGWLNDPDRWRKRREELAKRRREEHQQMFPRLSGRGALFALALLFVPVGIALMSIDWVPRWLSVVLTALPLVVAALISVAIAMRMEQSQSESPDETRGSRFKRAMARLYQLLRHPRAQLWTEIADLARHLGREFPTELLTAQTISETRSTTVETADPTSVEFGETFRDLLDEALCDDRRLVLAIDNLDRVDPDDALAIWSTLQTFLQASDHQRPAWFERLWVLVPFARDGLAHLWSRPDEESKSEITRSFMDKTFQVKFQIPPPALSNWRSFLEAQLDVALPKHGEDDQHGVYRAFALRTHRERAKPTPRELKLFVNEIGALHRQWHDDVFSLKDYACFTLLQRTGSVETAIRATPEDGGDARFAHDVIGQDWKDKLAALYFNTPIPIARQILLREPIESALAQGDGATLRELADGHPDGFWTVFEDTSPSGSSTWENVTPTEIAAAAHCVATSQILDDSGSRSRSEVVSFLGSMRIAAERVEAWEPLDKEMASGLAALCKLFQGESGFIERLLESISRAEVESEEGTKSENAVSPVTWLESVRSIVLELEADGLMPSGGRIDVPLMAAQWIAVAPDLVEEGGQPPGWLKRLTLGGTGELDAALEPRVAPGEIDEATVRVIEATVETHSSAAVRAAVMNVLASLQTTETISGPQLSLLLRVVDAGRKSGLIADAAFGQLAVDGHILHHLHQAAAEQHAEAAARLAFSYLQSVPDGAKPSQTPGNAPSGYEALQKLLRTPDDLPGVEEQFIALVRIAGIERLLPILDTEEQLLYRTFRRFLDEGNELTADPVFIREHWLVIWNTLAETQPEDALEVMAEFEELLRRVTPRDSLISSIVGDSFDPNDATLHLGALNVSGSKDLGWWAGHGLATLDAERWTEALREPDDDVANLTLRIADQGIDIELGADFVDGLSQYAREMLSNEKPSGATLQLQGLVDLLAAHHRSGLSAALYRILDEAPAKAKGAFFTLFGRMIADRTALLNEPQFVARVCEPMLQEGNLPGLEWLEGVLKEWPDLLEAHRDEDATLRFRDRLESELRDLDDGDETVVTRIAGILGVSAPEKPDDGPPSASDVSEAPSES